MQQTFTRAQVLQLLGNSLADSLSRLNKLEEAIRKHGDLARAVANQAAQRDTIAADAAQTFVKSSEATKEAIKVQDNVASLQYALEVERSVLLSRSVEHIAQVQQQYNEGLITLDEYVRANSWDALIHEQVSAQLRTFEALL